MQTGFPINDEQGESITAANVTFAVKNLFRASTGRRLLNDTFGVEPYLFARKDRLNAAVESILEQENRLRNSDVKIDNIGAIVRFDTRLQ